MAYKQDYFYVIGCWAIIFREWDESFHEMDIGYVLEGLTVEIRAELMSAYETILGKDKCDISNAEIGEWLEDHLEEIEAVECLLENIVSGRLTIQDVFQELCLGGDKQ
jgi:hypothetical protein